MVTTRRNIREGEQGHIYSQQSLSGRNKVSDHADIESLTQRRRRWASLFRTHNYYPIISEVLDEELPKYEGSTVIDVTNRVSHIRECALILASAPLVFSAAIDGNLVRRYLVDSDLKHEYDIIQARAHVQPSIYIHLLADENGVAPTANQYLTICDAVLRYVTTENPDHVLAHLIDNISPPSVSHSRSFNGYRKYLMTANRLSASRRGAFHRLCDGIHARWQDTPILERDTPFTYPPGECGYSANSHNRLAQHRAHQSSNYVMNLVEDVCIWLHRTRQLPRLFRMHQFIIYLLFRPSQAALAEIFCSGLLQVWVENGGGFNAYPAGRSVQSASRVNESKWYDHQRWVRDNSPLVENLRMQRQRLEEWKEALDSIEDEWEQMDIDGM